MNSDRLLNRRQMLQVGAAALTVTALNRKAMAAKVQGWIDAHVHVWTPDILHYPIGKRYTVADMQPPSFTPEELFTHCQPSGVNRVVLIQMSYYQYDNSYMVDVIAKHPGVFSGVAIVDHQSADLDDQIRKLVENGVKGFRIHATGEEARRWIDDPGMGKLFKVAAAKELAVCPLINPVDIATVDALCAKYPDTNVVIDHFARIGVSGRIEQDSLAALCKLARFPNTYVKTSAFYALGQKKAPYKDLIPMIKRVIDSFGPQRLMWASDCPFQVQDGHDYESSLALIRDAEDGFLSDSDKQWLLRGTAEKVYF